MTADTSGARVNHQAANAPANSKMPTPTTHLSDQRRGGLVGVGGGGKAGFSGIGWKISAGGTKLKRSQGLCRPPGLFSSQRLDAAILSSAALPASAEMAVISEPQAMSNAARPTGQSFKVARLVKS